MTRAILPMTRAIPFNDLRRAASADSAVAEAVARVVHSGRYLLGRETAAFERELADYLGVDHVVGVASGTDALELAFVALGGAPGQEAITAANAGGYGTLAARRCGMHVGFADVDDDDLLVTPHTIEEALTSRTTIVVVTHLYGKMADISAICDMCHSRGILVIEDCAQATGARANSRYAGSVGDAAAFSFYPTKNLGAMGDGGAVVTSDKDTALLAHRLRQYGWGDVKYRVEEHGGRNSRLDEIQAAVLRARLPILEERNQRRREIVGRYSEALACTPVRMAQTGDEDYVAHLAVVRSERRTALAEGLHARDIGTSIHYPLPDHRQMLIGAPQVSLPVTEAASEEVLSLPCFPELEHEEVDTICAALTEVAESL
jgi:dTDP-3-amino-2,3,6-trideoxy-4-keto-D-glucose/dTDP-3-amino-3,4,6-trideoxy-alpha-D-glucose/dTDP-2,6-dideoxy-D-kanosamine transaminase